MKKLIIAEKPSVAKNIAEAVDCTKKNDGYYENDNYIITWAFGHLLSLYDVKDYDLERSKWRMDNFPFIPEVFEYKIKSSPKDKTKVDFGAKKQLNIISSQAKRLDVSDIISACDDDREGQIIGDIIFKFIKPNKPIYRLLLNEWTKNGVLKGLNNLKKNEEMIPLRDSGISRQWADWVIGINLTTVATLKYKNNSKKVLNIGRVLLPTLKIIYDRDKEIEKFISKDYFKLSGLFLKNSIAFEGIYFIKKQDKFDDENYLKNILENLNWPENKDNIIAEITHKEVNRKKEYPPYLFNLSNLQGDITSKHRNFTSSKVLKVAQSLYEKKYITYPRTSSIALEESLVESTKKVVEILKKGLPFENKIIFKVTKRIFDNKKVESHSAIIPTYIIPKKLTDDEKIVYNAIKNRLLMQFMEVSEYDETKLITTIKKYDLNFHSSGKIQIVEGWKVIEKSRKTDRVLPKVEEGDIVDIREINITKHSTKPPKLHTEKSLLKIMETCGKKYNKDQDEEMILKVLSGFSIGTAATRAEIISKLKRIDYIEYQNKNLITTNLGKSLVENFPITELLDLEYTGKLEKQLSEISNGNLSKNVFLRSIFKFTIDSVEKIKNANVVNLDSNNSNNYTDKEILGKCPNCGGNIIEGTKGYGCSKWKSGCKFVIWKNDKLFLSLKKKPTKTMVKTLLKNNRALVKGFTGKSGKKFDAYVLYEKNENNDYYNWKLEWE